MTCCTYSCTNSHGCAAHTEPVCPPCTHDCNEGRNCSATPDEFNQWDEIDRIESAVIWIIVSLCALLVSYMGFLAWRSI